jgi:glycosyltransferase involved in cell wall biosynthesis
VGRLHPEKNLRLLARVEAALLQAGFSDFRFLIAGQGDERPWLEENLKHVRCTGVLTGIPLAEAYANMDVFVFPSHTDTYGNVIQEAAASGVPSVVTSSGGPKFLVRDGVDGLVARTDEEFCAHVVRLAAERDLLRRMGQEARRKSEDKSWDRVFERVYDAYSQVLADSSSAS